MITEIINTLTSKDNVDLSKYKDSMRPLIEKDMEEAREALII